MSFPNPSINAEVIRSALVENDGAAASQNDAHASRASLDAEELRDLERSLYYGATSSEAGKSPGPAAAATPAPRRRLIDRLFRRG